jgi:hypothetical protein
MEEKTQLSMIYTETTIMDGKHSGEDGYILGY